MAAIIGKNGSIVFSGGQTTFKNWTISYVGDALETTTFDDSSGGRSYIPGLTSWSGTFDGFYSTGNTVVPGSSGDGVFFTGTTGTEAWTGGIVVTGMDIGTPVDGLVTQAYTFQGTSTLTVSSG